ncbi:hypothetical protein GCM10027447_13260 [Glycomyces halotolerans]
MTVPGSPVPGTDRMRPAATVGTVLWALLPLLTCGLGAPIAFGVALAKHRATSTLLGLIGYSAAFLVSFALMGTYGEQAPLWADAVALPCLLVASVAATGHLFLIRTAVWAPTAARSPGPPSGAEEVNRARQLRYQARQMAAADPMLAKRLGIGRPDVPRRFDDGGLVDVNHAPTGVLRTLPGVTEASARQIRERVERTGPFTSLGEVMLVVDISPSFEYHLREYVVFIP